MKTDEMCKKVAREIRVLILMLASIQAFRPGEKRQPLKP